MGYLKIRCGRCRGTWEIYNRDDWHNGRAQTCPHCFSSIEKKSWQDALLAFTELEDVNRQLIADHNGYPDTYPLFRIDYRADTGRY